eukprot:evm.model.scf_586.3 EVM.evm.TU.scf_586.3   scf_586:48813-49991(-)
MFLLPGSLMNTADALGTALLRLRTPISTEWPVIAAADLDLSADKVYAITLEPALEIAEFSVVPMSNCLASNITRGSVACIYSESAVPQAGSPLFLSYFPTMGRSVDCGAQHLDLLVGFVLPSPARSSSHHGTLCALIGPLQTRIHQQISAP